MRARTIVLMTGAVIAGVIGLNIYREEKKIQQPSPGPSPSPGIPPAEGGTLANPAPGQKTIQQLMAEAVAQGAAQAASAAPWEKPKSASAAPTLTVDYLGNPAELKSGQRYGARLELSGFETMAGSEMLAGQFTAVGFRDVQVFMNENQLPAGWPKETALNPASGSRWVEALWGGADTSHEFPKQVVRAWRFPARVA
jgi:hypothetical protein